MSDCMEYVLRIFFLVIVLAVFISLRIIWRILLRFLLELESCLSERPNREVAPKDSADVRFLQKKEDSNELEECFNISLDTHPECDSDESEQGVNRGQAQNSIDVAETKADDTIPELIEAFTESEEFQDILPEYQNREEDPIEEADSWESIPSISDDSESNVFHRYYSDCDSEEQIEEADSMKRQSSISPYCESPDCVCHVFERYYSNCDSVQTFDYEVSELPSETLEEDYEVDSYSQYYPDSYSLRFFIDNFPHLRYKVLVNESDSLDEEEGQECPIHESSDSDSDYVDDMTFDETENQAEYQHQHMYIAEADSGSGGRIRPHNHDSSELMDAIDIEQNFEEQTDSDEERHHHKMSAISTGHMLDVINRKLSQMITPGNPSSPKNMLMRNTIRRLEEVQPQESSHKLFKANN